MQLLVRLRRGRTVALAALALVASGSLASARPAEAAPIPFGFNDNAVAQHLVTPAQDAQLASEAGATVARITVDWRWAQPQPNQFNFSMYDSIYQSLVAKGIRPLWVPLFAPYWAMSTPCNQWASDCRYPPAPSHYADYARFAAILATRYPKSAGIEVWNEENLQLFWSPAADPAAYTQLLKTTYTTVKQVAPRMPVVLGGLSNYQGTSSANMTLGTFLYDVYTDGGAPYMDAISVHPYPTPGSNDMTPFTNAMWMTRYVRDYFNDATRPIWVTEVGVSTDGGLITPTQQASDLSYIYNTLAGQSDVKLIVMHTLVQPTNTTASEAGFGIVDDSLNPTPAFCTIAALRGSSFSCSTS